MVAAGGFGVVVVEVDLAAYVLVGFQPAIGAIDDYDVVVDDGVVGQIVASKVGGRRELYGVAYILDIGAQLYVDDLAGEVEVVVVLAGGEERKGEKGKEDTFHDAS